MAKLTRREFEKQLAQYAGQLRARIEAEVDGFTVDTAVKRDRLQKQENDFRFFCLTYFPHYVTDKESNFHRWVSSELAPNLRANKGNKFAIAAPRGEAKSTLITQLYTLWCLVNAWKWFTVIIMDTADQAVTMLEAIKAELESNPRLAQDFPDTAGRGRVWQIGVIVTRNNRKVQAFGALKRLRGLRHGPHRPDLVLLDDIENDENVRSLTQRDKLVSWINKAVLKLGPPDGTMDVCYIGTILHYDSVLARIQLRPTWRARVFKAILEWPDRMDLWDRWEELLLNEGETVADQFYKDRLQEMNRGAVVSWPEVRPLVVLMKIRADDHDAFACEMQQDPSAGEFCPFSTCISFWVLPARDWIYYGACDPSLGKNNTGRDPSALLIGGYDREKGVLDVVEASISRRVPDRIISDIINLQAEYHCQVWGIETIQFQEFLRTELVKRSAILGIPVPARAITPSTDKALRIESLQPHVANQLIRLHRSQHTLLQQLKHWPEADHDDGPDALQMLWMLALSGHSTRGKLRTGRRRNSVDMRGYEA